MATLNAERLLQRMREVLEGASVTLRAIATNTYGTDLADGLNVNEEARRTFVGSNSIRLQMEPTIARIERSAASPPVIGNIALYDVYPEVRVVVAFTNPIQLTGAIRDSIRGILMSSADVVAQAYGYPGNMTTTSGGNATGLVSGLLAYTGSDFSPRVDLNQPGGVYEAVHRFRGVLNVAPAVS